MDHDQKFHFRDGNAAGSLEELRDILEHISYQEFYHHVNTEKNDFANWIRDAHSNTELADDLEKVTSIVETVEIINDFVHPMPEGHTHDDIQSKIEEDELHIHIPVEEVATTEPTHEESEDLADLEVIQEKIDEHEELPVLEEPDEPPQEEPSHEEPPEEPSHEEPPAGAHQPESHAGDHVLSQKDYNRMIVKDFVFGLIAGLVIGVILGRILSY